MSRNEYLYGKHVEVTEIPQELIDERVALLRTHLAKLLDHSYHTRDGVRCNKVIKAISFWEKLNDN